MFGPLPVNESARLGILHEHQILDSASEAKYDDLVHLAAHVCGTPIAGVSLIDAERQWLIAKMGLTDTEAPRDAAICAHTILHSDITIIPDALADTRFSSHPLVTGAPHIRFYAGVPLLSEEGYPLGTLFVIDRIARTLTPAQKTSLALLGRQASSHLQASRHLARRDRLVVEKENQIAEQDRLFTMSQSLLCIAGDDGYFKRINPMFQETLGFTEAELLASPIIEFVHPDDRLATLASRESISRGTLTPNFENRYRRKDGSYRWLQWNTVSDAESGVKYAAAHDITERKRAEEQVREYAIRLESQKRELERANAELAALATTDGLTGLHNHRAFQERLAEEALRAARYGAPLSLVLLDVDNFKQYNDAYGHPAGDTVLKTVAGFMQEGMRETDLVARYGGEEFTLLLPMTDLAGAAAFAQRLKSAIESHPWPVRAVTASFGVASLWLGEESGSGMLSRADEAMYRSKAAGGNQIICSHKEG